MNCECIPKVSPSPLSSVATRESEDRHVAEELLSFESWSVAKKGRLADLRRIGGISADKHASDQRRPYQQQQDNNKQDDGDDGRFGGVGTEDMGVMSTDVGKSRKVHVERRSNVDPKHVRHNDNDNKATTTTTTDSADSTTSHVQCPMVVSAKELSAGI